MWTPSTNSTSYTPQYIDPTRTLSRAPDDGPEVGNRTFTDMLKEIVDESTLLEATADNDHDFSAADITNTQLWPPGTTLFDPPMSSTIPDNVFEAETTSASSCGCTSSSKLCGPCRLKKRNSALRSENQSLRNAFELMRATLEEHYEVLVEVDEQGLLASETMTKLWNNQEKLRGYLGLES